MNKFKLGQRVKIIRTGKIGEIIIVYNDDFNEKGWSQHCYRVLIEGGDAYWFTVHDLELVKEVLDEKEKEYLNNIIKPFRDKVTFIQKCGNKFKEFISIGIKDDTNIALPYFEIDTMYKGMKIYKEYTLTELELED